MASSVTIRAFCEENLDVIQERGSVVFAICPYCGKGRNHWNIALDTGLHHCYRCGHSGNFAQLVKHVTGLWQSPEKLEEEYSSLISIEMLEEIHSEPTSEPEPGSGDWTENTVELIEKSRHTRAAQKYLAGRGIAVEFATQLGIRVAVAGRYENCLIIPVYEDGEVKNFVARRFRGSGKRYLGPHRYEPYTNKAELIWGLDRISLGDYIVLVEGIFDAIALYDMNGVAALGSRLSDIQISKIIDRAGEVVVLLDAGFEKDARKIASRFVGFVPVKIGAMPEGDPAENSELAKQAVRESRDYYEVG